MRIAIEKVQIHGRHIAVENGHDMEEYRRKVVESVKGVRYVSACKVCKRKATVYWNEYYQTLGISGGALLNRCGRKRRKK